jgi:hypothetical protein
MYLPMYPVPWLPTVEQIVMASERPILVALDAVLVSVDGGVHRHPRQDTARGDEGYCAALEHLYGDRVGEDEEDRPA